MDTIPKADGGTYYGVFNLLTGVACFIGPLLGGYIFDHYNALFPTNVAYAIAVDVSLLGRFIISWGFLSIHEVKTFPESLGEWFNRRKNV